MKTKFDKIIEIALGLVTFLLPLTIVPFFTDIFGFGKTVFLGIAVLLIFVLFTLKFILEKKATLPKPLFLIPLLGLFLTSLVSGIANTPDKIQSFVSVSGAATLFFLLLFYLYIKSLPVLKTMVFSLAFGGVVLVIINSILSLGIITLPLNFPSFGLSITEAFSPIDSILSQTIWLAALVPLVFAFSYRFLLEKKNSWAIIFFIAAIFVLAGIGLGVNTLSASQPILLSKTTAWNISMETLKNIRLTFFGVGPGQFVNAFTSFKPISFNSSPFWEYRFGTANYNFQLLTELGLVGFVFCLLLVWKIVKNLISAIRKSQPSPLALGSGFSLLILLVCQYYFPINISLLFLFFVILAIFEMALGREEKIVVDISPLGHTVYLFLIFPLIFWGAIAFFGTKSVMANNYYLNSLKATASGNGTQAYELQIKAVNTQPKSIQYHIAYSNTNFALANALASKQDLNDNDRNAISQLVQQAIREAKSAVAIDPNSAVGWENLAALYRNLVNFAEGADQWTIASYQEAIKLDPLNPKLRLDLGGVYYSQKNYNQAATLFNQAVGLKQDFANAHYNLANALRELGALQEAKAEYELTQSLVNVSSNDYQKVVSELDEVKKRLPAPTPAPQLEPETLSKPETPSEGINPPLEINNEPLPVLPENGDNVPETTPIPAEEVQPQE